MLSLNFKNVQHVKIYLPCNFLNFNTFRPLFQKLLEINVKFKLQTCSVYQDLPTWQFLAHLYELLPSIGICCPSVNFFKSPPLKPLGQFKPHVVWIILMGFPLKVMFDDPADQPSWPPCLLIEHGGKISKKLN